MNSAFAARRRLFLLAFLLEPLTQTALEFLLNIALGPSLRAALGQARRILVSAMLASLSASPAAAAQSSADATWHDGTRARALWVDPAQEAEFAVPSSIAAASESVIAERKPGSRQVAPGASIHPRRVERGLEASGTLAPMRSPLFFDNAARHGAPRALPGGVIVELKSARDEDGARRSLVADGLRPVRALVGSRIWLIESATGMPALDLANRLQQSGRYVSVEPNWWQPRVPK